MLYPDAQRLHTHKHTHKHTNDGSRFLNPPSTHGGLRNQVRTLDTRRRGSTNTRSGNHLPPNPPIRIRLQKPQHRRMHADRPSGPPQNLRRQP